LSRNADGLLAIDPDRHFSITRQPLPQLGKFALPVGGVAREPDLSVADAWRRIVFDAFAPHLLAAARSKLGGEELEMVDVERYMLALIALGIVRPHVEESAWATADALPGILGSAYIRGLLSRREWRMFKELFTGERAVMTAAFNETARPGKFVVPARYLIGPFSLPIPSFPDRLPPPTRYPGVLLRARC